jgi:hypothetical protein
MYNLSSTGNYRPLWSAGKLTFNDDYLKTSPPWEIPYTPFSVWIVITPLSFVNSRVFYSLYGALELRQFRTWGETIMYGSTYGPINIINSRSIVRQEWNSASSKNVVTDYAVTGDAGDASGPWFIFGNNYLAVLDIPDNGVYFEVEELIIRKQIDSSGDITDINNYLKAKYGL